MTMEAADLPRSPEAPGGVKIVSHPPMIWHNVGEYVIIAITSDIGLPGAEKILKIKKLSKSS